MERILVTGACGQIGSELVPALKEKYGNDNVISLDIQEKNDCIVMDVLEKEKLKELIEKEKITIVYHLACLLSATGEKIPYKTWKVNMDGLKNILEIVKDKKIRLFWPSSIAVFGSTTPRDNTPQRTVCEPTTMYGITKYGGELLCNYYNYKWGVDVRSVRYPGIISWKTPPGGGTTDYAVAIFYDAIKTGKYTCFVKEDTVLPMMYMDDAIKAALDIMDAPYDSVRNRLSYNVAAISFSAGELATEVKKHIPELEVTYKPDKRQLIADSWPMSIDDSDARKDWGWKHDFNLQKMCKVMIDNLKIKFG